jgi:hypothetical protein
MSSQKGQPMRLDARSDATALSLLSVRLLRKVAVS